MRDTAERTDPKLWEQVKKEITKSSKGGRAGEWSARKAQMAVQEYKKRGGGYKGEQSEDNSLKQWTDEEWGTKSGRKSRNTGERYLPREAREALSDEEYRKTSEKKRKDTRKGKQHSKQPDRIAEKTARYRSDRKSTPGEEPTKRQLMDEARKLDIQGRSKMDKVELQEAVNRART